MTIRATFFLSAILLTPAAAAAGTLTVIGTNADAQACFRAADSDQPSRPAITVCTRALADADLAQRDRLATLVNRGIVHFRAGMLEAALADFDTALAHSPGQPDALINKGIALLAAGAETGVALALLDEGLAGGPQRPWVGFYGRGVAHELAGKDALAYRDYRMARDLRPGWRLATDALARFSIAENGTS